MKEKVSYLLVLFIALMSVVQSLAQSGQPDVVCIGTTKQYYVNPTPGSSYTWKIDGGAPEQSTTNSLNINWTKSGIYTLTVQETTKDNCVGQVQSLQVTVVALPTATVSGTTSTCQYAAFPVVTFKGAGGTAPYTFTYNINGGTSKTVTTTSGDTATIKVPTTLPGTFVYNLVEVTDSKGFNNAQAATAAVTVNGITYSNSKRVICPLQLPYSWNGQVCPSAGTYTAHFINATGCDSVATLELRVESPIVSGEQVLICGSALPFHWNGLTCTAAGTYTANLKTASGCDSVCVLTLKVNSESRSMRTIDLCEGEIYQFNGNSYNAPGSYDVKLQTSSGCDSIITLVLNYAAGSTMSQHIRLFPGQTFSVNGNVYSREGLYTDIIKAPGRCDSIVVTELNFITIPNTITPNGDGVNDVFMPGNHVKIYNRNGILLFEGADGWDGTFKGFPVASGTYFYVLYFDQSVTEKSKEGYLTVVR